MRGTEIEARKIYASVEEFIKTKNVEVLDKHKEMIKQRNRAVQLETENTKLIQKVKESENKVTHTEKEMFTAMTTFFVIGVALSSIFWLSVRYFSGA